MTHNNKDQNARHKRDMELWYPEEPDVEQETCEHCGEILKQGYYDINNCKLCEDCAKLEFKEYFDEFEDLEHLKQICDYDSEEELIQITIEEDLYKFWKSF